MIPDIAKGDFRIMLPVGLPCMVFCLKCKAPVGGFRRGYDTDRGALLFLITCHGETVQFELTEGELEKAEGR